jgi:hypothetical protein
MLKAKLSLSVTIILSVMLFYFSIAFAGPIIKFESDSHDFGVVEQGTSHKHIFKFKNTGNEDLKIIEVKPSCGCTAALLSTEIITPGGEGELEVTFNSGKFKNKVRKQVTVITNEVSIMKKPASLDKGPRKAIEVTMPTTIRKLNIFADVKYDKDKENAIKRERERLLKESMEKKKKESENK